MVPVNEIYKRLLLKVNKNDTNAGIPVPKPHFVLMFNSEALLWEAETLDNGDDANLGILDVMLEPDVDLKFVKKYSDSVEFQLPENFFRISSSFSLVDKGNCKGVKIFNFEKKPLGFVATLADDFNTPSFEFEETPYVISHNKMKIYFDDFDIKKVKASFYRTPTLIDIEGYTKFDGTSSTNIDSDLTLEAVELILNRMAVELNKQYENQQGVENAKDRKK